MSYQSEYRKIRVGDMVRLREQLQTNGGTILAAGLTMKVVGKHSGLRLETVNDQPCPSCGIGAQKMISHVKLNSVERL